MQTVQREGVEFDMCPQCRGVWLDRGELEKLILGDPRPAPMAEPFPQHQPFPPPQPFPQPFPQQHHPQSFPQQQHPSYQQPRYDDRRRDDDDDDYRRKGSGDRPYKKRESWWSEIFD
jgi:Zn-finger nucleic acid-binding protein